MKEANNNKYITIVKEFFLDRNINKKNANISQIYLVMPLRRVYPEVGREPKTPEKSLCSAIFFNSDAFPVIRVAGWSTKFQWQLRSVANCNNFIEPIRNGYIF